MNLVVSFQFFCLTYYLFEISGTTFILHNLHLSLFYWLPVGLDEDSYEDCDEYYEDSPSSTMNLSPGKGRTLYRIFIIFMFFRIESSSKAFQPQQISPKWRLWRTKVVPFLFQKSTSPPFSPKVYSLSLLLLCHICLYGYSSVFPSVRLSSTANSGEKTAKNGQNSILFQEKILKNASTPLLLRITDYISIY